MASIVPSSPGSRASSASVRESRQRPATVMTRNDSNTRTVRWEMLTEISNS
jgi:hypothetical protein